MPVHSRCKTFYRLLFDLNCDTGEGIGNDAEILPFVTLANIACGVHAGDLETMERTADLCAEYKVAIGAHPSYPDRENFGRKDLVGNSLRPADVFDTIGEQIDFLQKIVKKKGLHLQHVKPHGALYNRAARDEEVGYFLCKAIHAIDPGLTLYGLSGSSLKEVAASFNLTYVQEAFADRTYQDNGSLTPRSEPDAFIETEEEVITQVLHLIKHKEVKTVSGIRIPIEAGTICIHGDGKQAVAFSRKLYQQSCFVS